MAKLTIWSSCSSLRNGFRPFGNLQDHIIGRGSNGSILFWIYVAEDSNRFAGCIGRGNRLDSQYARHRYATVSFVLLQLSKTFPSFKMTRRSSIISVVYGLISSEPIGVILNGSLGGVYQIYKHSARLFVDNVCRGLYIWFSCAWTRRNDIMDWLDIFATLNFISMILVKSKWAFDEF